MENSSTSRSIDKNSLKRLLKIILFCLLLVLIISNIFCNLKVQILPNKLIKLPAMPPVSYKFHNITLPPKGFLVFSENCHIYPFEEVPNSHKCKTLKYNESELFVQKIYDSITNRYRLHINSDKEKLNATCCYKEILFFEKTYSYGLTACLKFNQDFLVPKDIKYGIIVNCILPYMNTSFFTDAFFFFQNNLPVWQNSSIYSKRKIANNLNILLVGIDGLSKVNFRQKMSLTFKFMQEKGWFQLSGYNAVTSTTFPTIKTLLAGLNTTDIHQYCQNHEFEFLDDCRLLFQKFQEHGYLTAYNEDKLNEKVFRNSPTDFYMLPLLDEFEKENKVDMEFKNITQYEIERKKSSLILNTLTEFALLYKNIPKFGLFYLNSISLELKNESCYNDQLMLEYMVKWQEYGIFQNNIFIFFSNYGMPWKSKSNYSSRFYEDRLPVMFIWLPPYIHEKYPEFIYALTLNKNRLTSPYDIFMTLQHLLSLGVVSNATFQMPLEPAEGCLTCQSVLKPIPENRTCEESGVSSNWCTCESYFNIDSDSVLLIEIINLLVQKLNKYLAEQFLFLCRKLKLKKIFEAGVKLQQFNDKNKHKKLDLKGLNSDNEHLVFQVNFVTSPCYMEYKALFIYFGKSHEISFDFNDIILQESNQNLSSCINDVIGKNFCICFED